MSDLIERQAAIDAVDRERKKKHLFNTAEDGLLKARGIINTLPSAQRKGKWVYGDDMFEYAICTSCQWDSGEAWEYALKNFKFCPNCGARMVKGEEDG